jgi:hypothetical protein
MSSLLEVQRQMASAVMKPLTARGRMQRSSSPAADELIKPNDRLSGFERLSIYNRQYWLRVLDSLAEDFPGLRAVLGARRFRRMSQAYLAACPSHSFTLRNLGSRLAEWLQANPRWLQPHTRLALDMAALEWAHIEAFDGPQHPAITVEELLRAGPDIQLHLQPYISLLQLCYPVDDLLLAVRRKRRCGKMICAMSNPASARGVKIFLAVHRVEYSVHYKRLEPEAFRLLTAIRAGADLQRAIEAAFPHDERDEERQAGKLKEWFALWQSLGWFCSGSADVLESPKDSYETAG